MRKFCVEQRAGKNEQHVASNSSERFATKNKTTATRKEPDSEKPAANSIEVAASSELSTAKKQAA